MATHISMQKAKKSICALSVDRLTITTTTTTSVEFQSLINQLRRNNSHLQPGEVDSVAVSD